MYEPGIDRPLAMITGTMTADSIRYFVLDELGNVIGLHDGVDKVVQQVTYDPWGVPTITGSAPNMLLWKGLLWESGSAIGGAGLYYMRARWYDPELGRFLSEDPIGVEGGLNLYVFAYNDPINGLDPSGLTTYLNCRSAVFSDSDVAHCGIRVTDTDRNIDVLIELIPSMSFNGLFKHVYSFDNFNTDEASKAALEKYINKWTEVDIPHGMTSQQFDDAVLNAANIWRSRLEGTRYTFHGRNNSNNFVYQVITSAGGFIRNTVGQNFPFGAPGICGGEKGLRQWHYQGSGCVPVIMARP